MVEILRGAAALSVIVFAISSMLSAGLSFSVRDIIAPLLKPLRVLRAVVANFVLVPLLAAGIARALALDAAETTGLILLGSAAGAPFLIKLTAIAAGDVALGTSLLVLLVPMTVVVMPLIVPVLAPDAAVNAVAVAKPLALTLLVPLAIGLAVNERSSRWAARAQPLMRAASTSSLFALLTFTIAANLPHVVDMFASRSIVAIILLLVGSFAIGYLLASPRPERRVVLAMGTAMRNIAAATIVAVEDIADPDTLVLVVVASLISLGILIPTARHLRTRPTYRMEARDATHEGFAAT
jgi:BASS family bile acid:Na+ symporter